MAINLRQGTSQEQLERLRQITLRSGDTQESLRREGRIAVGDFGTFERARQALESGNLSTFNRILSVAQSALNEAVQVAQQEGGAASAALANIQARPSEAELPSTRELVGARQADISEQQRTLSDIARAFPEASISAELPKPVETPAGLIPREEATLGQRTQRLGAPLIAKEISKGNFGIFRQGETEPVESGFSSLIVADQAATRLNLGTRQIGEQAPQVEQAPRQIRDVAELERLAKMGLTESDITRQGQAIFLKPQISEESLQRRGALPQAPQAPVTGIPSGIGVGDEEEPDIAPAEFPDITSRIGALAEVTGDRTLTGVAAEEAGLLKTIGTETLAQEQALRALPEAIRQRTEDIGVTQAQLNRLIATEREPIAQALKDLLTSRSLLQEQVAFRREEQKFQIEEQQRKFENLQESLQATGRTIDPVTGEVVESFEARKFRLEQEGAQSDILSPNEAALLGLPFGTTKAEAAELGIIPKSELNFKDKVDLEVKLAKRYTDTTKSARDAEIQINNMRSSLAAAQEAIGRGESINAASQGVLVTFQKLLDPTSVVRESEYARSGQGLSLVSRIDGKYEQLTRGGAGVAAEDLQEFVNLGEEFLRNYKNYQAQEAQIIANQAQNYGLNLENILPEDVTSEVDIRQRYDSLNLDEDYDEAVKAYGEDWVRSTVEQLSLGGFENDLGKSVKGQDISEGDKVLGLGGITGFGSRLWKHGLDIDLKIGDPVPTPVSGIVKFTGVNGGFGNQVVIETRRGEQVMLSHLDSISVREGQKVSSGSIIGRGGNTGNVIPLGGGDGSHLDLTVKRADGSYVDPKSIAQIVKSKFG